MNRSFSRKVDLHEPVRGVGFGATGDGGEAPLESVATIYRKAGYGIAIGGVALTAVGLATSSLLFLGSGALTMVVGAIVIAKTS